MLERKSYASILYNKVHCLFSQILQILPNFLEWQSASGATSATLPERVLAQSSSGPLVRRLWWALSSASAERRGELAELLHLGGFCGAPSLGHSSVLQPKYGNVCIPYSIVFLPVLVFEGNWSYIIVCCIFCHYHQQSLSCTFLRDNHFCECASYLERKGHRVPLPISCRIKLCYPIHAAFAPVPDLKHMGRGRPPDVANICVWLARSSLAQSAFGLETKRCILRGHHRTVDVLSVSWIGSFCPV